MNWYMLMRMDNGEIFDELEATDASWAAMRFLKKMGGDRLTCDVAIVRDGMVHAIVSERGGRRPDVMVIAQMRAQILGAARPQGTRQAATA